MRRYLGTEIRNNIERFRFQSLTARYNTLSDMWNRRLRAIEEGRPLSSVQLKQMLSPTSPSRAGAAPRSAGTQIRLSTLREDEEGVRDLYERFMSARAAAGESELRFESFRHLIAQQRIRFLEEKNAVAVDFRIAVQDGKVALKAKPVRTD